MITVSSPSSWTGSASLTLSAYSNIVLNAGISNARSGDLTLRADNTGTGVGAITKTYDGASGAAPSGYSLDILPGVFTVVGSAPTVLPTEVVHLNPIAPPLVSAAEIAPPNLLQPINSVGLFQILVPATSSAFAIPFPGVPNHRGQTLTVREKTYENSCSSLSPRRRPPRRSCSPRRQS